MASADVLLNPSATEAFGNVNLEAMAAGLAVISADAPSSRALIEPGRTGLLIAPGDIGGYAEALDLLAADRRLRTRLGQAARRESERYDWDTALGEVAEAYVRLTWAKAEERAPVARRRRRLRAA